MKTRRLSLIGTVLFALLLIGAAQTDPERDPKIRKELRGAEVPNHIVFGLQVADFRDWQQKQPDIAWQIVKQEMHLDSEEAARVFLHRAVTVADALDKVQDRTYRESKGDDA